MVTLPDPALDPAAYNQAIRDHVQRMVDDQAKLIEERYGYGREDTATAIRARRPNMAVVLKAREELAEFQRLTAAMFARFLVPEPIVIQGDGTAPAHGDDTK